jgi:hypothetical protein
VQRKEFLVTRIPTASKVAVSLLFVAALNGVPLLAPALAGAIVDASTHAAAAVHGAPRCSWKPRDVKVLPTPRVGFEAPYVPGRCDPLRRLPRQAWKMFACVRWREGGDLANQPNGAGMYQFTNRATWDEFKGTFPEVPSDATPLEQDIVAYRVWKTEQFLPWNGDPCLGSVHEYGKWGWY